MCTLQNLCAFAYGFRLTALASLIVLAPWQGGLWISRFSNQSAFGNEAKMEGDELASLRALIRLS